MRLIAAILFLAFGLSPYDASSAGRGFSAMPIEGETRLIAMGARHYDPATGRFLQTDPLGFAADQLYAYGAGNSFLYWDPSGLAPQGIIDQDPRDFANAGILADPLIFRGLEEESVSRMMNNLVHGVALLRNDTVVVHDGYISDVKAGVLDVYGHQPAVHYPFGSVDLGFASLTGAIIKAMRVEGINQGVAFASGLGLDPGHRDLAVEQARYEIEGPGASFWIDEEGNRMIEGEVILPPHLDIVEYWWYAQQLQPGFPGLAIAAPESLNFRTTFSGHVQRSAIGQSTVNFTVSRSSSFDF